MGLFWQAVALCDDGRCVADAGGAQQAGPESLSPVLRLGGYLLAIKCEGWERFCAEFQVSPDALMSTLGGWDAVREAEATARRVAFTPEEAATWLSGRDRVGRAPTAEDVAAGLRAMLDQFVATWK